MIKIIRVAKYYRIMKGRRGDSVFLEEKLEEKKDF